MSAIGRRPTPSFRWEDLDAARERAGMAFGEAPPDAFTVEEYADRYDVARPTASHQLARLVRAGVLQQGFRWSDTPAGKRRVRCYWYADAR